MNTASVDSILSKCATYCNDGQIYPAMRFFVEEMGMPVWGAAKEVRKMTKGQVTVGRAQKIYERRNCTNVQCDAVDNDNIALNQQHTTERDSFDTCATSDLQKLIDSGKKFSTVYADPPWQYSNQGTRAATNNHYETMTISDIAALPIASLVADNAHLHLWTTNAFLFDAKSIMEAWGFQYKSCFIWVKPQMGIGNYWRVSHEFMLLGVRGSCPFMDRSQMSWAAIDRTKHSAKPEVVAQKIEKTSPGPYLELFGRQTREGWTVWGNEIEKTLFNEAAFADSI
jgi:N6-adenosine-specific RNA methylase IME4